MARSVVIERDQSRLLQSAQPEQFRKFIHPLFDGGIRTDKNPSAMSPNELSAASNVKILAGRLIVDYGYSPLGPNVIDPALAYQVFYPNGTDDLLLISLHYVYRFVAAVNQWQYVTWGQAYQNTLLVPTGGNSFTLSAIGAITTGSVIGIELDDGSQLQTTVNTVAGPVITTADPVPMGRNAPINGPVMLAQRLHGNYNTQVCAEEFVDGAVYITNGVDPVFYVKNLVANSVHSGGVETVATNAPGSGSLLTFAAIPPGVSVTDIVVDLTNPGAIGPDVQVTAVGATTVTVSGDVSGVLSGDMIQFTSVGLPSGTTCQWILTFHEQLYLFNTQEGGTAFPQRVRVCDQANAALWLPTALGGPGGLQAIYNLTDTEDFILTAAILGPWMIVYRETTIMRASYLGILNETLLWEYMLYGEGALSQGSVSQIGDSHLLIGNSGVYLYRGDYSLESIGDAVYIGYFSAIGQLNPSLKSLIFTQYIGDFDEVWVFYPSTQGFIGEAGTEITGDDFTLITGDDETIVTGDPIITQSNFPFQQLTVELDNNGFYPRIYENQFVSAGPWLPLEDTTWATAAGTWSDYTRPWNSRVFTKNVPNVLLCSPDANRVMVYDYTTRTDNGRVIEWELETKDWQEQGYLFRTDSIRLFGQGTGVLVEYSIDGSDDQFDMPPDYVTIGVVNFGSRHTMKILTFQIVANHIRFRISGSDPSFMLMWAECWYLEESEW